ncbi:MAG: hypothetical protein WC637_16030 [Victivallales bacterium]
MESKADNLTSRYGEIAWELGGFVAGLSGSGCIAAQLVSELRSRSESSLSLCYTGGFLLIFAFWTCYGLRFGRKALWMTNGIAVILQIALIIVSRKFF